MPSTSGSVPLVASPPTEPRASSPIRWPHDIDSLAVSMRLLPLTRSSPDQDTNTIHHCPGMQGKDYYCHDTAAESPLHCCEGEPRLLLSTWYTTVRSYLLTFVLVKQSLFLRGMEASIEIEKQKKLSHRKEEMLTIKRRITVH